MYLTNTFVKPLCFTRSDGIPISAVISALVARVPQSASGESPTGVLTVERVGMVVWAATLGSACHDLECSPALKIRQRTLKLKRPFHSMGKMLPFCRPTARRAKYPDPSRAIV
jgi:hypothetical protein